MWSIGPYYCRFMVVQSCRVYCSIIVMLLLRSLHLSWYLLLLLILHESVCVIYLLRPSMHYAASCRRLVTTCNWIGAGVHLDGSFMMRRRYWGLQQACRSSWPWPWSVADECRRTVVVFWLAVTYYVGRTSPGYSITPSCRQSAASRCRRPTFAFFQPTDRPTGLLSAPSM